MLYILLTIIAIGVLLASEEGKKLLSFIFIVLTAGGLLFLGFWIVVISIDLFSDEEIKEKIVLVFFVSYVFYAIYTLHKKYQRGELTKEIIKARFRVLWMENWKNRKGFTIFMLTLFSLIPVVIIWSLINGV